MMRKKLKDTPSKNSYTHHDLGSSKKQMQSWQYFIKDLDRQYQFNQSKFLQKTVQKQAESETTEQGKEDSLFKQIPFQQQIRKELAAQKQQVTNLQAMVSFLVSQARAEQKKFARKVKKTIEQQSLDHKQQNIKLDRLLTLLDQHKNAEPSYIERIKNLEHSLALQVEQKKHKDQMIAYLAYQQTKLQNKLQKVQRQNQRLLNECLDCRKQMKLFQQHLKTKICEQFKQLYQKCTFFSSHTNRAQVEQLKRQNNVYACMNQKLKRELKNQQQQKRIEDCQLKPHQYRRQGKQRRVTEVVQKFGDRSLNYDQKLSIYSRIKQIYAVQPALSEECANQIQCLKEAENIARNKKNPANTEDNKQLFGFKQLEDDFLSISNKSDKMEENEENEEFEVVVDKVNQQFPTFREALAYSVLKFIFVVCREQEQKYGNLCSAAQILLDTQQYQRLKDYFFGLQKCNESSEFVRVFNQQKEFRALSVKLIQNLENPGQTQNLLIAKLCNVVGLQSDPNSCSIVGEGTFISILRKQYCYEVAQ